MNNYNEITALEKVTPYDQDKKGRFTFDHEYIYFTTYKGYDSFSLMKEEAEKCKDFKKDFMKTVNRISFASINEIQLDLSVLKVIYTDIEGKRKTKKINFDNVITSEFIKTSLVNEIGFKANKRLESKNKKVALNLLIITLISFLTYFFHYILIFGEEFTFTSSRQGRKSQLAYNILEMIGSTNVLIIGGLLLAYYIYSTIKRYRNPQFEEFYTL
ncbi:hypothetical protein [Flammeovirga aprica]|uniref:Uncharacterized protein n=1 Tax=Flammeovirga aprica JL-4 TaxID=694437 RepID=A0A7X9RW42_9BACT|nr:hypothetical protein [Flammeovirga aprica]NME69769.1 hypothetical protein [Flammeovirga aprica JL-4]